MVFNSNGKTFVLSIKSLLTTAFFSVSHAQTVASSNLPETLVTATRFAEPLGSLPLGVSVVSAEQIRASGASTVNEAVMKLLGVPGRQDSYGGGDYALDLRGFGTTSDSNQVVVLDGVRLNEADLGGTRLAGIPIDTVERIEVLRGSGSVLYGEGATGGVIVITTKAGNGTARRLLAAFGTPGAVFDQEALALHFESLVADGEPLPHSQPIDVHLANPDNAGGIWAVVDFDITPYLGKSVRFNATLPQFLLQRIDDYVQHHPEQKSRSGFLAAAALRVLQEPRGV